MRIFFEKEISKGVVYGSFLVGQYHGDKLQTICVCVCFLCHRYLQIEKVLCYQWVNDSPTGKECY